MRSLVAAILLLLPMTARAQALYLPKGERPDLSGCVFVDRELEKVAVADLRHRVVAIELWTIWCPPCRMSLPELLALQKAPSAQGLVEVIPCNMDPATNWPGRVKRFMAMNSWQLPEFRYFRAAAGKGNLRRFLDQPVDAFPTTLLLDRQGRLAVRWSGYRRGMLVEEVNRLLVE